MLLSISIPTYNRCRFLAKNLECLSRQIQEHNLCNEVEINVSNNGSNDETTTVLKKFAEEHKDIIFRFRENKTNLGPDANFIYTMEMSRGQYTLMLGDDDFLTDDALNRIISFTRGNPEVDIFLTNRDEYNEDGEFLKKTLFIRDDIEDRIFDFSIDSEAGYYFYLCKDVGACLTFISSIVYKTSIVCEYGKYDHSLDGTYYSFWFYLWQKLRDGGKLKYIKDTFIKCTMPNSNNNFGKGMNRILVEFNGFSKAAEVIFKDPVRQRDFIDVLRASMINKELLWTLARSSKEDLLSFNKSLLKCKWRQSEINALISIVGYRFLVYCVIIAKRPWLNKLVNKIINI